MKKLIQVEELAQFVASIVILYWLPVHVSWWLWPIIFLAPDLGMIGYVINTKMGAFTYNLTHHKLVALVVIAIGFYLEDTLLQTAGVVLYGHSAMDRILGYGLKYSDDFKHTHLGWLPGGSK